ncbi:hypothetical protein PSA5_07555 [Pseudomonas syringae pv. actinidiae]|nr:hypothetical protein PSA5_07555 [Pseudomonas syringae pv. actinidiae]
MGKQSRSKRASPQPMAMYRSHVAAFRSRYLMSFLTPIFMAYFPSPSARALWSMRTFRMIWSEQASR